MKSVDDDVQQVLHTLAAPSILLDSDKQHFDLQRPVHLPTWMLIVQPSSWIQLWSDPWNSSSSCWRWAHPSSLVHSNCPSSYQANNSFPFVFMEVPEPASSTPAAVWSLADVAAASSAPSARGPSCACRWCRSQLIAVRSITKSGCWCCLSAGAVACLRSASSAAGPGWSCRGSSCWRPVPCSEALVAVGIANGCMKPGLSRNGISEGQIRRSLSSRPSLGCRFNRFGDKRTAWPADASGQRSWQMS